MTWIFSREVGGAEHFPFLRVGKPIRMGIIFEGGDKHFLFEKSLFVNLFLLTLIRDYRKYSPWGAAIKQVKLQAGHDLIHPKVFKL